MYISKVSLVNYRNFKNAKFEFNKNINTIIGENGSGKTNLFRAIRLLLDDNLLRFSYKLDKSDFNRELGADSWKGHWIIISLEFSELSQEEAIQALFVHSLGNATEPVVDKATYNLFFRPNTSKRFMLSELEEGDTMGLEHLLNSLTIDDYETIFTGKSTVDFNNRDVYQELVGDFENVKFNFDIDTSRFGIKIPHQLSLSNEVSFTFIKALRDVVADFHNNRTNPLLTLLKYKSDEISEDEIAPIIDTVIDLNEKIENLEDVKKIGKDIETTIKEAVGETYAPSSLSIKSEMSEDTEKLLQSLRLFVSEPDEDYEGAIHELSLGGANLIFLTLKLLEYKYRKDRDRIANFLLIEEPEAHIHTHIQKTLFDNLEYEDTQIIYSTHSTHISDVSKISNMNILAKKRNCVEVYQPSRGLEEKKIVKLERYLDAVRSNLLFAKGVILVEGDAEAIVIPNLIKKVLGISLDELGISLINIGSTGFENVAQIFHDDRIRRKCAIITDLDSEVIAITDLNNQIDSINIEIETSDDNEEKQKLKKEKSKLENYFKTIVSSAKSGRERKIILDEYILNNQWIEAFYAQHTFEVDFIMAGNSNITVELSNEVYSQRTKREESKNDLESNDKSKYGKRILTIASKEGKGWMAISLSNLLTYKTKIPDYILDALLFVKPLRSDENFVVNLLKYRIKENFRENDTLNFDMANNKIKNQIRDKIELADIIEEVSRVIPSDPIVDKLFEEFIF